MNQTKNNIVLTETIPDDIPDWAIKLMAEQQLFNEMFSRIDKLDDITKVKSTVGNYDVSEYMRGMANGLILAQSIIIDEEPVCFEQETL